MKEALFFFTVFIILTGCLPNYSEEATTDKDTSLISSFITSGEQYEAPTIEFAFGDSLRFENLTTDNGLSNSNVLDVIQDSEGYIWIATEDGLNRYDGKEFKIFRYNTEDLNSISANPVFSLLLDDENTLWVGTNPGGLNKYDPKT